MYEDKVYVIPNPIVDLREVKALENLNRELERLTTPSKLAVVGEKVSALVPQKMKTVGKSVANVITEKELFEEVMKVFTEKFTEIQKYAAVMTVNEKKIIERLNSLDRKNEITDIEEACLLRSYKISKEVNTAKLGDMALAAIEGGATGFLSGLNILSGLATNIVLSTLLYYRAVQWIATSYGYDVKRNPAEMTIAASVFTCALSPTKSNGDEISDSIFKFMVMNELAGVKAAAAKSWADMIAEGSVGLLLTQIRALANKSAQKALEKAGKHGLENHLFKNILTEIGKKLKLEAIEKSIPYLGTIFGVLTDAVQMKKVLDYAEIFYHKRFIDEKATRINLLIDCPDEKDIIYIDV